VLAVDAVLPFADKELEGCTVGDVLADPERFEHRVLADPIEGVSYGRTTAMVMLRRSDGYPWIKSFAHGGMSYALGHRTAPPYSEEALALTFADRHANTLRYVAEWGQWLIWDGTCWRMDRTRQVFTLARELCREVAPKADKPSERRRIASAKTRAALVSLAGEDRRLAANTEQWDADLWLLNTPDGVVDLHTGRLREHQATDYMTKQTAVSPKGECLRWMAFLQEVTGGDDALQKYLQRISGYFLTGVTTEQELYFFYGSGKNGKGVWTLSVSGILHDYHRSTSIETFTVAKSERHPTELAGLRGARLVTAAETEEGRRWAEARIKELTGGDKISARFMRQDFFDFFPQFKLLFSGNHMPTLRTVNKAITRRFNRIPFAVTIPDERVNKHLAEELKVEWPGILAWAIEGCLEWQRVGLCPPKAVTDATESYLESEDILGEWLDECCIRDANAWESSTALFNSWKGWAVGREEWIGSVKTFSARLEDRGEFKKRRNPEKTKHGFAGLRLKVTAAKGAAAKGAAESAAKIDNLIPLRPHL
jgi:putative DNA primase/helicase